MRRDACDLFRIYVVLAAENRHKPAGSRSATRPLPQSQAAIQVPLLL
jgi:hypothetical protein